MSTPRTPMGALIAAAILLAVALPSSAAAAAGTTYCVLTAPGVCPAGAIGEPNLTAALAEVDGHGPGVRDTIVIGSGSFQESGLADGAGHPVDIVGAGVGVTTLKAPAASPTTTLTLDDPSSTVSDLSIDAPAGPDNTGLALAGRATNVAVSATADDEFATGVKFVAVSGSASPSFAHGSISLPFSSTTAPTAVSDLSKAVTGSVTDSNISAFTGIQGVTAVDRTRITTVIGAESANTPSMTLDDDLITTVAEPGHPERGILVQAPTIGGGAATALIRHCTVIGAGSAGSLGVSTHSQAGGPASAAAIVDSSIVRGYTTSLDALADGGASSADTASASIAVDHSDFETTSAVAHNGGSAATATIARGASVTTVDPQFAATAGPLAFQLSAGSPMIDAGDPSLGGEESSTDLLGHARAVAGRAGDAAASDIGAFEFQPVLPTVGAVAPHVGIARTPVTFAAHGGDSAPGDSVIFTWTFDDGASATGTSVSHAFATAGPHVATVIATDLDGFTAETSVTVTITTPVRVISDLHVRPSRVVAAAGGPSVTTARRHRSTGGVVTYLDSDAGPTLFAVLRAVPGVLAGHACFPLSHRRADASGRRCAVWLAVGSFTQLDHAGDNRFRFTGRIDGRKLRRGAYRLVAVPHELDGNGGASSTTFRVVHR